FLKHLVSNEWIKLHDRLTTRFPLSQALEKCKNAGLTKSIEVSNFNHKQLEMTLKKPGLKYKPFCNYMSLDPTELSLFSALHTVEFHRYLKQRKLLEFCKYEGIVVVTYSALRAHRDPSW
ncbi:hypothetical protein HPG69_014144, partial [Diceros bicornis minor]